MPYDFTPSIKPFLAASIIESLRSARPISRQPSTSYSQGTRVSNGGNEYVAIISGTTGSGAGPTNTTGVHNDGTIQWLPLGTNITTYGDINSNLYLGIGALQEWSNPSAPPAPEVTPEGQDSILTNLTALVQVGPSNSRQGIPKENWVSGSVYSQYDPDIDQTEYTNPHYVIVDDIYVYMCLDNNSGANSIDSPSGTSGGIIEKADGYIWKYVGSIASKDLVDFGTTNFVPVPNSSITSPTDGQLSTFIDLITTSATFTEGEAIATRVAGDGNGGAAAVRTSTSGGQTTLTGMFASNLGHSYSEAFAIAYAQEAAGSGAELEVELVGDGVDAIAIESSGSGYVTAQVIIIGDGTGAEATATISGGQVTVITMVDAGENYTWAKAFVIPGTAGGVARAVLAPSGGHGYNPERELNAGTVLISSKLAAGLNNYIPTAGGLTDGTFRQVSLIGGVRAATGSNRNAEAYIGPSHPLYNSPGTLDKYLEGSGNVVYINNIVAITHTNAQEETIKVSISL